MTILHVLDNATGPPTVEGTFTNAFDLGMRWKTTVDGAVIGVRWLTANTSTSDKPAAIYIWDTVTHAVVATVTAVPHDGSSNAWQDAAFVTPFHPVTGREYVVSLNIPTGVHLTSFSTDGTPTSPLSFGTPHAVQNADNTGNTYPGGTSSRTWGVDIVFDTNPSGTYTPGATIADVENEMERWLGTGAGDHPTSSTPRSTQALATGATGFDAIKAVADAVAAAVSGLPGTIASAVTTITGQLTSMTGTIADTAVVTTGRVIHDLAAVAINTQDTLLDLAKLSEGAGSFPADVGTLVWTLLDETDFVEEIAWAQPAEVYVLSITTRPHGLPLNLTDGVHTIYRCGWWTPLNGSFARQRSYIDFEDNHLTIGAERMPGILISLQPGGEGHLQAWALT